MIGSFLNVVVYRLGTGESVAKGRSRCFSCGTILQWYDLIPLMSFVLQKGRCRYCGSKISWQYPIVELIMGIVFLFIVFRLRNYEGEYSLYLLLITYYLLLFSLLIAISVYDVRHKIIPNQLVYPFIFLSFFFSVIHDSGFMIQNILNYFLAGLAAFLFFASLWYFSRGRWMGFGDAKLALGIGFLLGPWLTLVAVLLSFWIGTLIAVPVVLYRGGGLKTQIPFGPFLAAGCFISWLAGSALLEAYRAFLL
ncbi:MAG: leader peptidase (prepilin peptidase) / N-methyltransferase [Parcubacteria group bacterium Gr01-1014_70]|nr:MAG: leader peptidase (prepilin peptidase) / N-methyltransferase [Parcubacteria group bacterium Gr01-1014_70]